MDGGDNNLGREDLQIAGPPQGLQALLQFWRKVSAPVSSDVTEEHLVLLKQAVEKLGA